MSMTYQEQSSVRPDCPHSNLAPFATLILFALASLLLASCASQKAAGTEPDDMSVEEHQAAAAEEEEKAQDHREKYDPNAKEQKTRIDPSGDPSQVGQYETTTYNPTKSHLEEAKKHERHAEQHEKAAKALLDFEQKQCAKFPDETRANCPLMGQVEGVEDVNKGAKLSIADGVSLDAITDHMRCHFAFARTEGYDGMETCPLYLEKLSFEKIEDDHAVIIQTDDSNSVEAVRKRSRDHVE